VPDSLTTCFVVLFSLLLAKASHSVQLSVAKSNDSCKQQQKVQDDALFVASCSTNVQTNSKSNNGCQQFTQAMFSQMLSTLFNLFGSCQILTNISALNVGLWHPLVR